MAESPAGERTGLASGPLPDPRRVPNSQQPCLGKVHFVGLLGLAHIPGSRPFHSLQTFQIPSPAPTPCATWLQPVIILSPAPVTAPRPWQPCLVQVPHRVWRDCSKYKPDSVTLLPKILHSLRPLPPLASPRVQT